MTATESSRQKLINVAVVIVIALLAINAFLLFNKYKQNQVIEEQKVELSEADQLRSELEKQYHRALNELEALRSDNEELNALIDQQKSDLSKRRREIEKMIGRGGELSLAKEEIGKLKLQISEYFSQIETLKAQVLALTDVRDSLSEDNLSLREDLDSAQLVNEALAFEKENLSVENRQLSLEKAQLAETVNLASVIKIGNISVTPLKVRSSGKAIKKTYAKNVDQLRVCFQTTSNELAANGKEYFLVRLISPVGETLAFDDQGAGVFISKKNGEEIRFSTIKEVNYSGTENEYCLIWNPNLLTFPEGKYKVEIYNKGHLAGTGNFELK